MESLILHPLLTLPEPLAAPLRAGLGEARSDALRAGLLVDQAALAEAFRNSPMPSDGNRKVVLLADEGEAGDALVADFAAVQPRVLRHAGDRRDATLVQAMRDEFDRGARSVAVLSPVVPTLPLHLLDHAFRALLFHDLVIGPDFGGGCFLVGWRRPLNAELDTLAWQPMPGLEAIAAALPRTGSLQLLPFWPQLGDGAPLSLLRWHAGHLQTRASGSERAALEQLAPESDRSDD